MKLDRLLAITMYLLNRSRVTAGELADVFQVSVRTIYRDLDAINLAGIPIVAYQGVGGGYGVDDRFTMSRSAFRPDELETLVAMLRGVNQALRDGKLESAIEKIDAIAPTRPAGAQQDAVVLDFTPWGGSQAMTQRVALFRRAIESCRLVSFSYLSMKGEETRRAVEPVVLILKGFTWYLYAYCRHRDDYRLFRLSRILDPVLEQKRFRKRLVDLSQRPWDQHWETPRQVRIRLRVDASARGRLEELFPSDSITRHDDGGCEVCGEWPEDIWLYSIILGLGNEAEVLEPAELRLLIRDKAQAMADRYRKAPDRKHATQVSTLAR